MEKLVPSAAVFKTMKDFVGDNKNTLSLTIVTLLIFAAEELLTKEFYTCPDKFYIPYGILVLLVPVICLITVVVVTQRFVPCRTMAIRAFIAGYVWIIFAFGETDVLMCISHGPESAATDAADYEEKFKEIKGISQIIALGMIVVVALVCWVYYGCCKKAKLIPKVEKFDMLACEAATDKINEEMKKLADKEADELCTIVTNEGNNANVRVLVEQKLTEVAKKYPRAAKGWGNEYRAKVPPEKGNKILYLGILGGRLSGHMENSL